MVTPEDIESVPLFAALAPAERERLARAAADIRLAAGEYAANEGDDRALFAVLAGHVEATKVEDGLVRPVGQRSVGELFGEVPIVLGTVFPVGFRATEPSRVMRIEPNDYHALAAVAPDIATEVGRLAANRMSGPGGLQGRAAVPRAPRAIVAGSRWNAECAEIRRFLERNHVTFQWLDEETPNAEQQWGGPLPSEEDCPTVHVLPDEERGVKERIVVRPQLRRLAELLGLQTEPLHTEYDTVIVGAGPAGLAAAVYGASEGLRTIAVERDVPGGQAGTSSRIENYLGFPFGITGDDLAGRALDQAQRLGAEILVTREITRIDATTRQVHLDGGDVLKAKTIILACGVAWRRLEIEGFERLAGKGVHYGAARSESPNVHGRHVHVIGAGNSAGQAALNFCEHASSVTIVCRGEGLEKSMSRYLMLQLGTKPNIRVLSHSEVVAAVGDLALEAVDIRDSETGDTERHESGGVFIFIGADAETAWLPPEIALDRNGFVLTGAVVAATTEWERDRDPYLLETSVPGIFACGDVRYGPVKRVAAAVGEGSMAIAFVHQYLRDRAAQLV